MAKAKSFLGIVPARYASSRFPGKPLADIHGKSMIQRVYEQSIKVYVATDDERIFQVVKAFGGKVVMTSGNHKSGTDRCAEAVILAELETRKRFDVVLNIQGDEPFIEPHQLELVKSCFNNEKTQIATLVKVIHTQEDLVDPNRPKVVISNSGEAIYFSRSPIPYFRGKENSDWADSHIYYCHIGLYGYLKSILTEITRLPQSTLELAESLEQLRWIQNGYRIAVRTTTCDSFGVDTPEDLERLLKY
jgi:3-deoxy-manno-octulosonate cytidylyltransferase (CMP-KDO synthetase)